MENGNFIGLSFYIYFIRTLFISLCSYFFAYKIIDKKIVFSFKSLLSYIFIFLVSFLCTFIKYKLDSFLLTIILGFLLSFIFAISSNNNLGYSILVTALSMSINYAIFFISIVVSFPLWYIVHFQKDLLTILIIIFIHLMILINVFKLKRIKHGFSFIKSFLYNDFIDVLILNISIIILFFFHSLSSYNYTKLFYLFINILISTIILIFTVKKLLTLFYKHNLLVKELNETKTLLDEKNKEISEIEQENIKLNKMNHSIAHKQKALEYKINEMIGTSEISSELSIINKTKEISNELTSSLAETTLPKTGIENIDNMLNFMQAECLKSNIIFELQLNGDIFHMINKHIPKEKLEILLADHIKNAIIAINSSDNINKSILVKLGMFNGVYCIYFYDSGIPFEENTLKLLSKKPITTHKDTGGTGFGFMNTFDTLKECNASIEINHIGPLSKNNYTKYILIKFDNKHEIKIN